MGGWKLLKVALPSLAWLLTCPTGRTEEIPLPIDTENWEPKVFLEGLKDVSEADALAFTVQRDPNVGPYLTVGPWRAGKWSGRAQFTRLVPLTGGTIRGLYRTEGLLPAQAAVTVGSYSGADRLHQESAGLGAAEQWTEFEVPILHVPKDANAISVGFGLAEKTDGRVLFARLIVTDDTGPARTKLEFPEDPGKVARPAPPKDFKKATYFRLEQRGGTWWLVSPEGKAFYSIGVDGPGLPKGDEGMQKGREHLAALRKAGFNSLAGWTSISSWGPLNDELAAKGEQPIPIFLCVQSGGLKGDFEVLSAAPGPETRQEHCLGDPFDPRFERAYRERVRGVAALAKDKAWLAGWFADNEVSFTDLYRKVYSKHCSEAFRAFLEKRYGQIAALNTAWGTNYRSFQDLIDRRPDPVLRKGTMYEDFRIFEPQIVRQWIEMTLKVFHEEDPGRLVFSNRFMFTGLGEAAPLLGLFQGYDGIAVNCYPGNREAGLGRDKRTILEMIHKRAGRPILITEWSIPALDSRLYDNPRKLDWSYPQCVATQTQRARQAAKVTMDFHNLPFVVGAHWFTWRDFDSEKRQANRGLYKANGDPWQELLDALTKVHQRIVGG